MNQECRLCNSLIINTSSSIRRCVDKRCKTKIFFANSKELYKYYSKFLDLTLTEPYYREILYGKGMHHRSLIFREAWRVFTIDIIAGKNRESIDMLIRYYQIRRKPLIAYSLSQIDCTEPDAVCPICMINKEDSNSFIFCPRCGTIICGYCKKRLRNRTCPLCRFNSEGKINLKVEGLHEIILSRGDKTVQYAILSLANLYYKLGNISEAEKLSKKLIAEGFWKALIILARIFFSRKERKKGFELLKLGVTKSDLACIRELGCLEKKKSKYYYSLALSQGDGEVLHLM